VIGVWPFRAMNSDVEVSLTEHPTVVEGIDDGPIRLKYVYIDIQIQISKNKSNTPSQTYLSNYSCIISANCFAVSLFMYL